MVKGFVGPNRNRETRLLYRKSVKSFVCCYGNQTIGGLSDTDTEFLFFQLFLETSGDTDYVNTVLD